MARRVRIVVGEGRTAQRGLLRFVLEGEGFDIVGEATGTADLSRVIEEQRPDVVVLDDGIGVMAVSMVHEVAPGTKIVLVWPSAVVPIGGDVRVEPAQILRDLGPAVEQVAAAGTRAGLTQGFDRPEWIDRIRKDPATLRDKLEGTKEATKRPSVTQLQRRGKGLHPSGRRRKTREPAPIEEGTAAPVVILPGAEGGPAEPVVDLGGGAGPEPVEERSEWNRRLGSLALSGAAAVSALVLALALGGGRVPVSIVRGGGTLPPGVPGFVQPGASAVGPFLGGSLGGSGYTPLPPEVPQPPTHEGTTGNEGSGGGTLSPGTGGEPAGGNGGVTDTGGTDTGGTAGGGGTDGGGTGGGGGGTDGGGTDGGGTGGSGTGGGDASADRGMPGKSADHNPHGGPPSKLGLTPAHGNGLDATLDTAKDEAHAPNGASGDHPHKG